MTEPSEVAAVVQGWLASGRQVAVARVFEVQGFSSWAGDSLVAVALPGGGSSQVELAGSLLGAPGERALREAAPAVSRAQDHHVVVHVAVEGADVAEAGLSCGGQAELLVQPALSIPEVMWTALVGRDAVALVTRIAGSTAGPESMVVTADGSWVGALVAGEADHLARLATDLLAAGAHATTSVDDGAGTVLIEAWVPEPRVVVVGDGELAGAIDAQAGLLGWPTRGAHDAASVAGALDWAGGSAAVVVLSHDPDLDAPALRAALDRGVGYVGALGSRRTQSRRLERLRADGVGDDAVARIRRPIGLDLGGRRPPEVALAVVAEILAVRSGRDGGPLGQRQGPIHATPNERLSP